MRNLLLIFAISMSAPALATDSPKPAQPGADKDKMICRRETPVGSLIASRKICRTKEQWAQTERDGNEEARKMVYDNQGRPTGN